MNSEISTAHSSDEKTKTSKSNAGPHFLRHPLRMVRGLILAHQIDCRLVGIWDDGHLEFHDHLTGSGFTLNAATLTYCHAKGRLLQLRAQFKAAIPGLDDVLDGRN